MKKRKASLPRVTVMAYRRQDLVAFVQAVENLPWWERVHPDLVEEFFALAQHTRQLQRFYRLSLDGMARRELTVLEQELDARLAALQAAIAGQLRAAAVVVGEGGAP